MSPRSPLFILTKVVPGLLTDISQDPADDDTAECQLELSEGRGQNRRQR